MAKKDKPKHGKIPKKIGGLKLSKELRRSGERLIEKAGTPEGRRVLAAGLAMASAAVAKARAVPAPAPVPPSATQSGEGAPPPILPVPPVPPVPSVHPAPDGMGTPMIDPDKIAEAVGQAATAFFDGLFGRKR